MDAIAISRSGLDVEWRRMEIIALNLANMESSTGANRNGYVPLRLVSGPAQTFEQALGDQGRLDDHPNGVRVYSVEPSSGGPRRVYEPGHPHADAGGFVNYPDVSHAEQMTLMIRAARAYEANLAAMAAAQQIYSSALQIGRRQ